MKLLPIADHRPAEPIQTIPPPPPAGFALWELGFRPFFLAAALWAVVGVLIWIYFYAKGLLFIGGFDLLSWHRHEMLFGFAGAVICGFLLSAPGHWTKLPMPSGGLLIALFSLWAAGRVTMAIPSCPPWLNMAVNVAALPAMAIAVSVAVLKKRQWRNMRVMVLPMIIGGTGAWMHLGRMGVFPSAVRWSGDVTMFFILMLISVIGGRVMPFFTSRALNLPQPRPMPVLDTLAPGLLLMAAGLTVADAPSRYASSVWALAGIAAAMRCYRWFHRGVLGNPLLWSLHTAFAFLSIGCFLEAAAPFGWGSAPVARHAFTVGCIGMACISMMSRVARGHTGRPLRIDAWTLLTLRLALLSAMVRVFLPLVWPAWYVQEVAISGSIWSLAFAIWFFAHLRILTRPGL